MDESHFLPLLPVASVHVLSMWNMPSLDSNRVSASLFFHRFLVVEVVVRLRMITSSAPGTINSVLRGKTARSSADRWL